MKDFRIPTHEELYGENRLEIFRKMNTKSALTDFAIETGAYISEYYVKNDFARENRTGYYFTNKIDEYNDVYIAGNDDDDEYVEPTTIRNTGIRLVLPYDNLFEISMDELKMNEYGVPFIEYGNYVQSSASRYEQKILEYLYKNNLLNETGNIYTVDSVLINDEDKTFSPKIIHEYEYAGNTYVRIKANPNVTHEYFELSNGERYLDGEYIWNKVEPVRWLVDKKNKVIITEKLLLSGIQFNYLEEYINKYFSKELLQNEHKKISSMSNDELLKELECLKEILVNATFRINEISENIKKKRL